MQITIIENIKSQILQPVVGLLIGVAVLVFFWGLVEFIYKQDRPLAKQAGQQHMIWGAIGFLVMFGVYGLLTIVANTIQSLAG